MILPRRWPAWASTLIIRLSKTFSVVARHLHKRGSVYYYVRRIPEELRNRYSSEWIRQSLKTTDERAALRAVDRLTASFDATFAAMLGDVNLTPAETHMAAQALADKLGPMEFAEDYFSDLFNAHATKLGFFGSGNAKKPGHLDPDLADEMIKETDYLDPVQQKALALIRAGNSQAPRLATARTARAARRRAPARCYRMRQVCTNSIWVLVGLPSVSKPEITGQRAIASAAALSSSL